MDLFNNDVGIAHCTWCVNGFNTSQSIADNLKIKLDNGNMKYLTPLDFVLSPKYPIGLNGITINTILKWTNQ